MLVLYTYVSQHSHAFLLANLEPISSIVLWEFCLRHPEVRDVCDIGQMLFWGKEWAWYATAVMFILNNTFIQVSHPAYSVIFVCSTAF
jgi:hypothetical protein